MKQDPAPFIKRVSDWKEALPFGLAFLGLLYGIGWTLQYQAVLRLGVGPISITREAAMGTAVSLLGLLIPVCMLLGMLEWLSQNLPLPWRNRWGGTFLLSTLCYVFVAFVVWVAPVILWYGSDRLLGGVLSFFVVAYGLVWIFFLLRVFIQIKVSLVVLALIAVLALTQSFSRFLQTELPESLGGEGKSRVTLTLKEPDVKLQGTLAASDSETMILRNVQSLDQSKTKTSNIEVLRLPISRIVEIQANDPPHDPYKLSATSN